MIHNNQKVEANQVSNNPCINRMWYVNTMKCYLMLKEGNYDTYYNMDGPL